MEDSIFIPSSPVIKEGRRGGGSPFQDSRWETFESSFEYDVRKEELKTSIMPLINNDDLKDKQVFAEVKYDEKSSSKSSRPANIWEDANLEIVQSVDPYTYTLLGTQEDFEQLKLLINESDFDTAKGNRSGVTTRQKNIAREVYAIAGIRDKNIGLENRIDLTISQYFIENKTGPIECIIELYPHIKRNEYEDHYKIITGHLGDDCIKMRNSSALEHGLSYNATLSLEEISYLLKRTVEFNFIKLISVAPSYISERSISNLDFTEWKLNEVKTNEIVGIVDSGVSSPLFNSTKLTTEKFRGKFTDESKNHGTSVGSRVLFGDNVELAVNGTLDSLTPIAKILDVQVLFLEGVSGKLMADNDKLLEALDSVTRRYPNVKIYNLSIANDGGILDERYVSELTEKIDKLARYKDILFVCVAGNNAICADVEYKDLFSTHIESTLVLPPGDNVCGITVGSITSKIDDNAGTSIENYPSPFTRKGLIRESVRKPELVAEGGNYLSMPAKQRLPYGESPDTISENMYGVITQGTDKPVPMNGTSISAPYISNQASIALDAINNSEIKEKLECEYNTVNLLRTMLVHSTGHDNHPAISDKDIAMAYGFGAPKIYDFFATNDNKVTIMYCDSLDMDHKVQKLLFQLPDFVANEKLKFTFTYSYLPPVNRNYEKYSMIDVSAKVRVPYERETKQGMELVHRYINPSTNKRSYDKKGSTINHFSKIVNTGLSSNALEVIVQMYLHEQIEKEHYGRTDELNQPYALALTIEDLSGEDKLKQALVEMGQIEALATLSVEV